MDGTLTQVLGALYEAHQTIDRLQAELRTRDQHIAELEAALAAKQEQACPP